MPDRSGDRLEVQVYRGLEASVPLTGCEISVPLAEIYAGATLDA